MSDQDQPIAALIAKSKASGLRQPKGALVELHRVMQLIRGRMEHWRKEPKDRNPLPAADYVIANLDWALSNLDDVGWELESALRAVPPQKHEEKEHEGLPGTPGQGNPLEPTPRREVCGRCGKEHCENTKDTRDGFTDPDYGL